MTKERLIYISNTKVLNARGGWDGLAWKIYSHLKERHPQILLRENTNPPISMAVKFQSKALRLLGLPGSFPIFNSERLRSVSKTLDQIIPSDVEHVIFHGSTTWVEYAGTKPYSAFLDCSFMTYLDYYHTIADFKKSDIRRIKEAELKFFKNAHSVFFSSQWAIEETRRLYNIEGSNFFRIGQGPTTNSSPLVELPLKVKNQFLFVGLDFLGKGGAQVHEAFEKFLIKFPDYKLVVAGQQPPDEYLRSDFVHYAGFIDKSKPHELVKLEELFRDSKALVMMTRKDIAPVAVIEAGLQGCISIANRVTALPELVQDNISGFLINNDVNELYEAMLKIASLSNEELLQIRKRCQQYLLNNFSWKSAIDTMDIKINEY
jgi:glycosyltransferase involved in cell wall biosynthesis